MKRAKAPDLVVGLDVGTTKVCAIITEPGPRGVLNVLGVGTAPSHGLRRGIVVNIDSTVEAIKAAIAEAEQMAKVEVAGAFAGIGGGHIRGVNSRGVVGITGKNHEVGDADVERVIEAARAVNLPQDREIIHVLPQSFTVDDGDGVREPIGMSGVRLVVEVHIVTGTVTSVQNVVRSVNRAGLAVQDIVLEPLASAEAVLFDDEKELGVVVTGGTSIMEGVPELAEGIFDQPVRRGVPIGIGGMAEVVESPIYATGVGLALYGARTRASGEAVGAPGPVGRFARLVTGFLGDLF